MTKVVVMTVNVHGIGPELTRTAEPEILGGLSHGRYTYKVGLARLIEVFARQQIKATFFWPSTEAARVPALLERCLKDGHEVASHGRAFENYSKLAEAREREVLQEAHDTLRRMGAQPVGYRSPTTVSLTTFKTLSDMGYIYDSSNIDDDCPYSLHEGADLGPDIKPLAPAKGMIELPWSTGLTDATTITRFVPLHRTDEMMIAALDGLLDAEGWACITLHPRGDKGLARASGTPIIERLVARARDRGAEFSRCRDVASRTKRTDGRVVWNGKERR